MSPPDALATLRAVAEVFVPGVDTDQTPGAPDVEAERFVEHYLELLSPGAANAIAAMLDGLAVEMSGRPFATLPVERREEILAALADRDDQSSRDVASLLGLLSIAAVFGEWTGIDADGAVSNVPLGWELTGFDGPVRARPKLLRKDRS